MKPVGSCYVFSFHDDGASLNPAGYKYTVSEVDVPSGYMNASLSSPSGTLTANSTVTVEAVNDYRVKPVNVTLQTSKKLMGPSNLNNSSDTSN